MRGANRFGANEVPNEVPTNVDMFGSVMKDRIVRQRDCAGVV